MGGDRSSPQMNMMNATQTSIRIFGKHLLAFWEKKINFYFSKIDDAFLYKVQPFAEFSVVGNPHEPTFRLSSDLFSSLHKSKGFWAPGICSEMSPVEYLLRTFQKLPFQSRAK